MKNIEISIHSLKDKKKAFVICIGIGFLTGRDSATFRDNGTEVPSLSHDKGTTGQAKNLAKGWDGLEQPKFGMGRAGTARGNPTLECILDTLESAIRQSFKGSILDTFLETC